METDALIAQKDAMIAQLFEQVLLLKDAVEELAKKDVRIHQLEHELAQMKRWIYGQRSERFIPNGDPGQLSLFNLPKVDVPAVEKETISYERKKKKRNEGHPGRNPLPAHLPRKTVVIEPEIDTSSMKRIGEAKTETLEYIPGRLYVREIIRPKYVEIRYPGKLEEATRIHIAPLPYRPLGRTIAGTSLLAYLLTSKYIDHLPWYRIRKIFAREGVRISDSTLSDWAATVCVLIRPLYDRTKEILLSETYLMSDDTHIKVLDSDKKGKTHKGYFWVYLSPEKGLVWFDYQKGRGNVNAKAFLDAYAGTIQVDGYKVYKSLVDNRDEGLPSVRLINCMAHARRYFEKALGNDRERAEHAMTEIQRLYKVEREAGEAGMDEEDRQTFRQEQSTPILEALYTWMKAEYQQTTPTSAIGKAIRYALARREGLKAYVENGRFNIDNNPVENAIRPVALGRKNYLFAGSHDAAQNSAVIYSLLGSCEKNGVNPYRYLIDVMKRVSTCPPDQLDQLLPHVWVPLDEEELIEESDL